MSQPASRSIQLIIDGPAAGPATAELLDLSTLSARQEAGDAGQTKGDPLTLAVSIVAIVGGTLTAAEQIRAWYELWRTGKEGRTLSKVIIEQPDGQRYLMQNVTVEQLTDILETLK